MTATLHPRFGLYAEHRHDPDVLDVERVQSHPAFGGTFSIAERHTANGYAIVNDQASELRLMVAERPDAEFLVDLLNAATLQLQDDEPTKKQPPTAIQRAAEIGLELHQKRQQLAQLEAAAGDPSTGKSGNQHAVSGAAEGQRHDQLTHEITLLDRELASLEAS